MPRIRSLKPELWDSRKLASVSHSARLVFIGAITMCDDYGSVRGDAQWLRARLLPYDDLDIETFRSFLAELEGIGIIVPYESGGERFFLLPGFVKHQRITRPSLTRNPEAPQDLLKAHGVFSEHSVRTHGALMAGGEGIGKGKDQGGEREAPPSKEDKTRHLDFVLLTEKEYEALIERLGEDSTLEYIEKLNIYIGRKQKDPYRSHFYTLLGWYRDDQKKAEEQEVSYDAAGRVLKRYQWCAARIYRGANSRRSLWASRRPPRWPRLTSRRGEGGMKIFPNFAHDRITSHTRIFSKKG